MNLWNIKGLCQRTLGLCQWHRFDINLRFFWDPSELIDKCIWPAVGLFLTCICLPLSGFSISIKPIKKSTKKKQNSLLTILIYFPIDFFMQKPCISLLINKRRQAYQLFILTNAATYMLFSYIYRVKYACFCGLCISMRKIHCSSVSTRKNGFYTLWPYAYFFLFKSFI